MATFRTRSSGTVEACIRRKILPGPIYLTFKDQGEAERYCREAEAMIDAGHVPPELLEFAKPKEARRDKPEPMAREIRSIIDDYLMGYHVTEGDKQWLGVLREEIGAVAMSAVTVQWSLEQVRSYKLTKKLTPATIRHRIGALRRCIDWHVMVGNVPMNPLRLLPTRYASYNDTERIAVGDESTDDDNERDRRIEPGEESRIWKVLRGDQEYIKEIGVERGLNPKSQAPMTLLTTLALETAMRMREMYTVEKEQIDLPRRTVFLDRTKNGSKRQVPLSSVAVEILEPYMAKGSTGPLFPELWDGSLDKAALRRTSGKISGRWRTIAKLAKCEDLHFHDLRHEATSRIYERTTLTDLQIAKITGHKDLKSLQRYANLRASSLAERLW